MRIAKYLMNSDLRPARVLSKVMTTQLVFFCLFAIGCSSNAIKTPEFNKPYGVVRVAVQKNMPLGIRTTSRNGRTFQSNYFVPSGIWDKDGTNARERAYAQATILGPARPYTVEATVFRQRRLGSGEYSAPQRDDRLSEELANKIEEDIANRRDDRNVIDDFNAF